jgi:predicted amidohydrolase YtcJ
MRRYGLRKSGLKLLLHSGRIRTLDPACPSAQAMIVDRDRIAWVGANEDIVSIPADEYRLIDLSGRTVLPSFTDSHVHLVFFARSLANLDLHASGSCEEVLDAVKAFAVGLSRNEWLIGKGWSKDEWPIPRLPHRKDLDRIVANNPVALFSKDQHLIWTNSLGLRMGGINMDTPDPEGGRIYRDEGGVPTGILAENAASSFFRRCRFPPKRKALDLIDKAVAECHRKGVTAVGNFDDDIRAFDLLQECNNRQRLRLRVRHYLPVRYLDRMIALKLRSGFGDKHLRIAGVKLYADGALGSQTALMFEPYRGTKGNHGVEVSTESEMAADIKAAASHGIACAVHAIGDLANHQVLNAFAKLPRRFRRLRHRIEHVQVIKPDDIPRFAELGVTASVQPCHCSADIELVRKYWGRRSKNAYPFRDLLESGAAVAFGSDAPVEDVDPILGMYSATTRSSFDGRKRFHPEQRIPIADAVAGFTTGGARALADDSVYGTIKSDKSADIVILRQDPFRTRPRDLKSIEIDATFFEGECVYGWENINR